MNRTSVCPWWAGNALRIPVRKLIHNPDKILKPYVKKGMTAVDIGCGMGYFTIPMAGLTGPTGLTIAADLQQKMLEGLQAAPGYPEVGSTISCHQSRPDTLKMEQYQGKADFVLVFMMLHEVPDQKRLVDEISGLLKPGGICLFAEPIFHVSRNAYRKSLKLWQDCGYQISETPYITICRSAVLEKR